MAVTTNDGTPLTAQGEGIGTQTATYTLPLTGRYEVQSVVAEIDATGAASLAELTILDKSGAVIAKKRQAAQIPLGDTGAATWALRLGDDGAAADNDPAYVDILPGLGLSTGVIGINSFAYALFDSLALHLVAVFMRLTLANIGAGPPYGIRGLPSIEWAARFRPNMVTQYGNAYTGSGGVPGAASVPVVSWVDGDGAVHHESVPPFANGDTLFSGFGVYPWFPN